jgi:hypothetical protein
VAVRQATSEGSDLSRMSDILIVDWIWGDEGELLPLRLKDVSSTGNSCFLYLFLRPGY